MGSFVKVAIQFDRDAYGSFRGDNFVYLEEPSIFIDVVTGLDEDRIAIAYIFGERAVEIVAFSSPAKRHRRLVMASRMAHTSKERRPPSG